MQGLSFYRGKSVIVSGADTSLGAAFSLRLADLGATVVAMGQNEPSLLEVARHNPAKIQTLETTADPFRLIRTLGQTWADTPLHLFVSVLPFREAELARLRRSMRQSRAMVAALTRALEVGHGRGILIFDDAGGGGRVARRTAEAAFAKFAADLQNGYPGVRLHALSSDAALDGWSDGATVQIVDLVLMLGHPVSAGLAPAQLAFAPPAH